MYVLGVVVKVTAEKKRALYDFMLSDDWPSFVLNHLLGHIDFKRVDLPSSPALFYYCYMFAVANGHIEDNAFFKSVISNEKKRESVISNYKKAEKGLPKNAHFSSYPSGVSVKPPVFDSEVNSLNVDAKPNAEVKRSKNGSKRQRYNLLIDGYLLEGLKARAVDEDRSVSSVIRQAIKHYLAN